MRSLIEELETACGSAVLVLATRNLDMEILPALYESLSEYSNPDCLSVLLYCRGGVVNAARRSALLLHATSPHLRLIVPHYCESSGTILALSAHEIVAGPIASFSPVDPHLESGERSKNDDRPDAVSAENIRLFAQMCQEWFGCEKREAETQALSAFCANIFPTTLTAFYRSTQETRSVCCELLALSMPNAHDTILSNIVDRLLFGYHSHTFSLTRDDLEKLGLPIRREPGVEAIAWKLVREARETFSNEAAHVEDAGWTNTIVATRSTTKRQHYGSRTPKGRWETSETV